MTAPHILVTGGAGFLGSHLCEALLARGDSVTCLDDFSTGHADNIAGFVDHPGFRLICADVTQPPSGRFDAIANLACPASPRHYQADPVRTTRTAVLGTLAMLELAHSAGARLLQASTSEVYGDPEVHPQPEGYWGRVNPLGPRACYDEGKRCAETLCDSFRRQHGTATVIARIFNTYGPRMAIDDGRVVSNFIVAALRGEPLLLYGDGQQTRSFCHVDDMVAGLIALLDSPRGVTGPVNLGNPQETSMADLARRIISLSGSHARLITAPLPADDPRQRCPDISLAHDLLGWQPHIPIETGLVRTIDWFKNRLKTV